MEILFYIWLIGAVITFFFFTNVAVSNFTDASVGEMALIVLFNIGISLIWFIYIPWVVGK